MDTSPETVTTISPPTNEIFQHWEEPLRTEMRGIRRLEEAAVELAKFHQLIPNEKGSDSFFKRFEENVTLIKENNRNLNRLTQKGETLAPSEEWLVDNFYLIAEQFREIREDLPREFYDELPKLKNDGLYGVPRIYTLAAELIANTDSLLDNESINHFINSYQNEETALTIGEIWALPVALRLVLIENLRRISVLSEHFREERTKANKLADKLLQSEPEDVYLQTAQLQKILTSNRKFSTAWLVQLIRRLRNQDERISPILETIEKKLAGNGYSTEQIFVLDQNQAAAAVVTIGNIITSFRWLKAFDWSVFFENVSRVDEILRQDPSGTYSKMDFATRNCYRQKIERIALRSKKNELEIARYAVKLSQQAKKEFSEADVRAHIGFYLLDDKDETLERQFNYKPTFREFIQRLLKKHSNIFYLALILLITALFSILTSIFVRQYGGDWQLTALTGLLSIVPAMTLAVSVLNWDVTKLFAPTVLAKMDFSKGIAEDAKTIVVIPTIFDSPNTVREIVNHLEVHYLANTDANIYFAILSDFADADAEEKPVDASILQMAKDEIAGLNLRYHHNGENEKPRFHLFHRKRLWSETEQKWLGWERKRGKLEEFNHLLRGAENTSFITATPDKSERAEIKYVLTLDSDTKLPPDTARKLIGIIAHPLNQPRFSGDKIERGYAILQPRVSITAESTAKSVFAQIMAGFTGLDPYTTAASDVYQDIFGAGIYTGKGLYVVDAFERALKNRIPPESLLSHDLFESLFARTALVSNVEFFDDYPPVYEAHAKRLHRWVRGDWQLLPWLFARVPTSDGKKIKNNLPLISRWKIFDNLRRSLIAPTIFLLLAATWILLPAPPVFLTLLMVFVLAFPVYAHVSNGLLEHPRGVNWENRLESFSGEIILNTLQFFLTLIFLPHQAVLMVDAIIRTIYRIFVSRKNLLEWTTAAQTEKTSRRDLFSSWRFMRSAAVLSVIVFVLIIIFRFDALIVAAPFLILWLISPIFAFYINQIKVREIEVLDSQSKAELRSVARQTWRFFQKFINEEDNWLPPDNFQEDPQPIIAHRTSPTNIGLLFLANVAANDFGYLGLQDLIDKTGKSLETVGKLEKFNGHLLNWYETQTLAPLYPKYVSTVDSGNLAGHLIALKQSLLEKIDAPVFSPQVIEGLHDGWTEAKKRLRSIQRLLNDDSEEVSGKIKAEKFFIKRFLAKLENENVAQTGWDLLLDSLERLRQIVYQQRFTLSNLVIGEFEEWLDSYIYQVKSLQKDAKEFSDGEN